MILHFGNERNTAERIKKGIESDKFPVEFNLLTYFLNLATNRLTPKTEQTNACRKRSRKINQKLWHLLPQFLSVFPLSLWICEFNRLGNSNSRSINIRERQKLDKRFSKPIYSKMSMHYFHTGKRIIETILFPVWF